MIAWIGSFLLGICSLPQAVECIRTKSAKGISGLFLVVWLLGEIFTLVYVFPKNDLLPLLFNYCFNILFISIIMFYKIKENK